MKKLQSLNGVKFEQLTSSQMQSINGGGPSVQTAKPVMCSTNGSFSTDGGKTFQKCPDRQDCATPLGCTEYLINGVWH